MPDIIPENIVVDNKDAAADNIRYIDEAIGKWRTQAQAGGQGGRILFPPGKIWIYRAIFLFEEDAGITLEGQGWNQNSQNPSQFDPGPTGNTLILNPSGFGYPNGTVLQVLSQNIGYLDGVTYGGTPPNSATLANGDSDNYAVGDCVFLFKGDVNATDRNPCQTLKITNKDPGPPPVTLTFDTAINQPNSIYYSLKYLKRSRRVSDDVAPGDTAVMLLIDNPADASLFKIGDYVLLSDGVGVVEVFGEYLKIASVTPNTGSVTITFTTGVAGINGATYPAAKTVLIPGPWAKGITIRNLQLGGNAHLDPTGGWGIKFAPDFTAENVRNWRGDLSVTAHPFGAGNCVNGLFLNCQFESVVGTNSCHDMRFIGCVINGLAHEEWSRDIHHTNNEISGYWVTTTQSARISYTGCHFRGLTTAAIYGIGQHTFIDCLFDGGSTTLDIVVDGGLSFAHIRGDMVLQIRAGVNNTLEDIHLPGVSLGSGTSGVILPPVDNLPGTLPSGWAVACLVGVNGLAVSRTVSVDGPVEVKSATTVAQHNAGFGTPYPTAAGHFKALSPTRPVATLETACTTDNPVLRTYQDRIGTMDATPTPLRTIPLSDNTQHLIRAVVLAHKTGGDTGIRSDGALFERVVRAKRDAGGPAILGAVRAPITDEDDANWDCTIVGSGNNAVVQVTGRELEAIAWHLLECQVGSWRTDPSDTNDYRQNLVVYWKLEEASGTRYDSTPGARNLTEHATDGHGVGQRAGRNKGSAAYFDGDEGHPNYLSIVDSLPLQLGNDADWYWCAWVYCISSIPLYSIVLAKRGLTEVEYQLHVTGAGDLTVLMGVPPTGLSQVTAMKPGLAADAWHFVEFWHDSATHILYVDFDRRGVPGFFSTASAGLKSTNPLYVGYDVAGNLHQGLVDELALYSSIPPDVIRDGLYGGIRPY